MTTTTNFCNDHPAFQALDDEIGSILALRMHELEKTIREIARSSRDHCERVAKVKLERIDQNMYRLKDLFTGIEGGRQEWVTWIESRKVLLDQVRKRIGIIEHLKTMGVLGGSSVLVDDDGISSTDIEIHGEYEDLSS